MKRRLFFRRWPGRFGLLFLIVTGLSSTATCSQPTPPGPTPDLEARRRERDTRTNAAPDSERPGDGTGRSHGDHGSGACANTVADSRHLRQPSRPHGAWRLRRRRPLQHRFRLPTSRRPVQAIVQATVEAVPTPTATNIPTPTPTNIPTPTPTNIPTPTDTPAPTSTAVPTATSVPIPPVFPVDPRTVVPAGVRTARSAGDQRYRTVTAAGPPGVTVADSGSSRRGFTGRSTRSTSPV